MVKTYGELYYDARVALMDCEGAEAANVARELICAASGVPAADIIAGRELYATEESTRKIAEYVRRKLQGEPLAYILSEWVFCGMTLTVTPDVLIPRDDTMAALELAMKKALFLEQNPRILDLCAGSGCIGLALANRVKDARVTLGELSPGAIAVAKKNIIDQKMTGRVSCMRVDAMKPASNFLGTFDLIVSNPPYVTTAEMAQLQPSVRDYEPHMALDGGEDGLNFYRAIVKNFTKALKPGGYLCFEFGMNQGDAVGRILEENNYEVLQWKQDNSDITRAVMAQLRREEA